MKKSGLLVASMAAASATAATASSSSTSAASNSQIQVSCKGENSQSKTTGSTEKFAPRFDGLRFIETLVTAHR